MASPTPGYCTFTATARSVAGVGVDGDGAVDLADRRRGDRLGVPLDEELVGRRARARARRPRRPARPLIGGASACSCGERLAHRLGQAVVEVAGHLAELHQRALHVAEALGDLLGACAAGARRRARPAARRRRTACGRRVVAYVAPTADARGGPARRCGRARASCAGSAPAASGAGRSRARRRARRRPTAPRRGDRRRPRRRRSRRRHGVRRPVGDVVAAPRAAPARTGRRWRRRRRGRRRRGRRGPSGIALEQLDLPAHRHDLVAPS